jgi:hypothetical protein
VSDDSFEKPEITKITAPEVQEELLSHLDDTDPNFNDSGFWFRFQKLEKEVEVLRQGFQYIYNLLADETRVITPFDLQLIMTMAEGVLSGMPVTEQELLNETDQHK